MVDFNYEMMDYLVPNRQRPVGRIRLEPVSRQFHEYRESTLETQCSLTLQDLCLLCVINNVDNYPVELLASLPRWLRDQLLNNLPVLDLCHLESTPVARGVDTNKIWSIKLKNEPKKRFAVHHLTPAPARPTFIKTLFQMTVYNSNTNNENDPRIVRLKTEMESAFQSHCNKAKFTNNKEEYLIKLTAKALSCAGTAVTLTAHKLVSLHGTLLSEQLGITARNIWKKQAISLAVPMGTLKHSRAGTPLLVRQGATFLTPHRLLPICEGANSIELSFLLTHTCKVRPTSICLDIDKISQPILENLQAEKIVIDNGLAVAHGHFSCLSIMKCLMEKVIVLRVESLKYLHITGPMITLIEAAMGNGKLKQLFCAIPSLYVETVQSFSNLFLMRNFYMLHLEIDDYNPQTMIKLLQTFMTVPCELTQKLIISTPENTRQIVFLTKQQLGTLDMGYSTVPECALHHKILQSYPQNHTQQYLLLLPCIRLIELQLTCSSDMIPFIHLCACHPDLQVKKLVLNLFKCVIADKNKLLKATIENDLLLLLSKPHLRDVVITGNWDGLQEAKEGLVQGLYRQTQSDMQLRCLTLDMVGYSDEDIQDLLKAIVSFPQHYRPKVFRGKKFLEEARKVGMTYDRMYTFLHGFVSRKL